MITLQQINVTYNPLQINEVKALQAIDLQINKGEFVVVVGANGSGKSTLQNVIAGSIIANSGQIILNETNVTHLKEHQRSRWIARVFQNPLQGTAPNLTIIENCRLAALRTANKTLKIGINKAFETKVQEKLVGLNMGLENKLHQQVGNLSGGQRQALTLIMSVLSECKVLLLDEPTAALDPKTAETIINIANTIIKNNNLTAILISHNLKDACKFGTRIIKMNEGQIEKDFSGKQKEKLSVEEIFSWF